MGRYTGIEIAPQRFAAGMERQLGRLRQALAGGMPRRGWKVGINVPEVLDRLALPHPGVGWIDGRRVLASGAELEADPGTRLHVEPELALRLARAVPPRCPPAHARSAIAALHPALEIVAYTSAVSGLDDVVASCMFHHACVLGSPASPEEVLGLGSRWPALHVGGRRAEAPRADLVPEDLGELVAFVATCLDAFGQSLEAGDLLLSGSYTARAAPLPAGEEAVAGFGPLGAVSVRRAARPGDGAGRRGLGAQAGDPA